MNIEKNLFICSYCLKPLSLYFIKCIECKNIVLCIQCFSYGIQGGTHKKNHIYSVKVSNDKREVFIQSNWNLDEEIKLLDAIELYGVGNWNDISLKVESHQPDDCRNHYINYYIDSRIGKYLLVDSRQKICRVSDHSVNVENSTLSPSLYETMPPCNLSVDDQVILGYMPKRDDFERDYDNDAESILCRLNPDLIKDDLLDALKVAQVGIYTQRLKERQRRKFIAREHDLIGPIMSCILNKRWKPSVQCKNSNYLCSKKSDCASKKSSTILLEPDTGESVTLSQPFTILSSNTLSSPNSKTRRQSRFVAKQAVSGRIIKSRNTEFGRNRPYDAFMINDNLKPFLRYLTFSQAKALLENLHREEILKFEISTIINAVKRGRRNILDMPLRYPSSTIFVKTRPRLLGSAENGNSSLLQDAEESSCDPSVVGQLNSKGLNQLDSKKIRRKRKARPYFFIRKRRR